MQCKLGTQSANPILIKLNPFLQILYRKLSPILLLQSMLFLITEFQVLKRQFLKKHDFCGDHPSSQSESRQGFFWTQKSGHLINKKPTTPKLQELLEKLCPTMMISKLRPFRPRDTLFIESFNGPTFYTIAPPPFFFWTQKSGHLIDKKRSICFSFNFSHLSPKIHSFLKQCFSSL